MISGSDLRARRLKVGISQYKFAQYAEVTSALLSNWELSKSYPSTAVAEKVKEAITELERQKSAGTYSPGKKRSSGNLGKKRVTRINPHSLDGKLVREVVGAGGPGPKVLTAFSGCGGMAEGFRLAGCSIEGFIELMPEARATFERNFPGARCIGEDITELDEERVKKLLGAVEIDIVAGGPPCQGFSLAGKRDQDDPRNQLFKNLLLLADLVKPKFVVMENVRLLLSMKDPDGGLVIDRIVKEMAEHGYDASVNVVNAQDYGVPQFRERVFIIATRKSLDVPALRFPSPTHGAEIARQGLFDEAELIPYRTFRDATADLLPLESGESCSTDRLHWAVDHPEHVIRWLRDVPEGMSAHDNEDPDMRPPSGYNTTYKRLNWDEPASTIGTTFGMISASRNVHPRYTRSLTVREAMRIQTFPDDFLFEGKWGAIRTMIGNAVPPLLSYHLAEHLVSSTAINGR